MTWASLTPIDRCHFLKRPGHGSAADGSDRHQQVTGAAFEHETAL